ncbi:MAG: FecR protein [uncultured bacterium]|nr:MAG: FecR protein [uncultured bacterium]HBY01410.1 hypothetical protein [Rikenellaceae bacterium]
MEERYKKAMEEAKDLANRMLNEISGEDARKYIERKEFTDRLNPERSWMKFWFKANKKQIYGISAAAASIVLAASILFNINNENTTQQLVSVTSQELMPANGNVVLTLASGEKLMLDSIGGNQVKASGVEVDREAGEISYEKAAKVNVQPGEVAAKIEYNELYVPKGRSYSVVLSDGTKVWLNAMSSIKYPVRFARGERNVRITGEAYFEVVKNEKAPFTVETNDYKVRVLGTSFNISSYLEESKTVTTLVSGAVSIPSENGRESVIAPGEQYSYDRMNDKSETVKVNTDLYTSWINNFMSIEEEPLIDIFKVLKRRYDIEVVFDNIKLEQERFTGKIPLNDNLSIVLKQLSRVSQVEFASVGNTINVSYRK